MHPLFYYKNITLKLVDQITAGLPLPISRSFRPFNPPVKRRVHPTLLVKTNFLNDEEEVWIENVITLKNLEFRIF